MSTAVTFGEPRPTIRTGIPGVGDSGSGTPLV